MFKVGDKVISKVSGDTYTVTAVSKRFPENDFIAVEIVKVNDLPRGWYDASEWRLATKRYRIEIETGNPDHFENLAALIDSRIISKREV